jgi:protein-tyrosine phosphatase
MHRVVTVTWVELEGAVNVRDLGGLPTIDGHTTRPGVLLRSDNLQDLTPGDIALLDELGVRTVLDLRTAAEVEMIGPGPLRATEVRHLELDLIPHGFDGREDLVERAIPDETAGEHAMDHFYLDYVQHAPAEVATALRTIADPGSGAVLVHCAAGKDRTGVICALALSLVGVRRDAVVADYVRTDERIAAVRDRLLTTDLYRDYQLARTLDSMRPHATNMERFLDRVDQVYGGVHGLAMAIGVDEETVARLSRRLLAS